MKYLFFLVLLGLSYQTFSQDGLTTTTLTGYWQGGDLYIQNPFSLKNKAYCAMKIYVNGALFKRNANTSAIHVKLEGMGFEFNQELTVEIQHFSDCKPRFVNPRILAVQPYVKPPEPEPKDPSAEEGDNFDYDSFDYQENNTEEPYQSPEEDSTETDDAGEGAVYGQTVEPKKG